MVQGRKLTENNMSQLLDDSEDGLSCLSSSSDSDNDGGIGLSENTDLCLLMTVT
jgi:hypothetical protein